MVLNTFSTACWHDCMQVEMHETIEAERAATCAVKQLRADLKEEKAAHEEKVKTPSLPEHKMVSMDV